MPKPAVSRDAFRGLFALYAARAHQDQNCDGEYRLLRLFGSTKDIPDSLLQLWSDRTEALNPESVGEVVCPRARAVADGNACYDHASAFLHALLKALDQTQH